MDDLYTGTNSGSFGNYVAKDQREEINQEAREKSAHLLPAVEILNAKIDSKIKEAESLSTLVIDRTTSDDDLKVDLLARKKYIELCLDLKSELDLAVRKVGGK